MARKGYTKLPSIKVYRMSRGLTQHELAAEIGISRPTLAWLESLNSPRRPGPRLSAVIAQTVGRTRGQIIDEYEQIRGRR